MTILTLTSSLSELISSDDLRELAFFFFLLSTPFTSSKLLTWITVWELWTFSTLLSVYWMSSSALSSGGGFCFFFFLRFFFGNVLFTSSELLGVASSTKMLGCRRRGDSSSSSLSVSSTTSFFFFFLRFRFFGFFVSSSPSWFSLFCW